MIENPIFGGEQIQFQFVHAFATRHVGRGPPEDEREHREAPARVSALVFLRRAVPRVSREASELLEGDDVQLEDQEPEDGTLRAGTRKLSFSGNSTNI